MKVARLLKREAGGLKKGEDGAAQKPVRTCNKDGKGSDDLVSVPVRGKGAEHATV